MPVILATWKAEIRKMPSIQGQPGQIVLETPSPFCFKAKWPGNVAQASRVQIPGPPTPPHTHKKDITICSITDNAAYTVDFLTLLKL
jgi:hypothetical protein